MCPPPLIETLPAGACSPPASLFPVFASRHGCVFLDSALPSARARHSILACEPDYRVCKTDGDLVVTYADGTRETFEGADEIVFLKSLLAAHAVPPVDGLPFVGGAIGYLGYEYGAALDRVAPCAAAPADSRLPALAFGFYRSALVHDHATGETHLIAPDAAALVRLRALISSTPPSPLPPFSVGPLRADLSPGAYADAIARIRAYIVRGDVYQVNFTQRFTAPFSGSAAALYLRLRALNPAPHAAYLDFGDFQIVSSTPERLLGVRGDLLETRPIKGTVARVADDPVADAANRARLLASTKDHAELLMIVDLARNDLGRVCAPGSVHVAARHELETYATVHHLVATVRGKLAPGRDRFDALRALHPGGSITGAPKIRAMQMISELEPARRDIYTGALGYLGYDGGADLAIAIRTITCAAGRASYHVGGGITWDSDPAAEYEETLHKGRAMHAALTT